MRINSKVLLVGLSCLGMALPLAVPLVANSEPVEIQITSPSFREGQTIPKEFTGDGSNLSPPLQWRGIPAGAKSIALICDDPDAPGGIWIHWVLFDLAPNLQGLPKGASSSGLKDAKQGTNSFRKIGYGGPAPPPGKPHRYVFRIYALDIIPSLSTGATARDLELAMQGHVLAKGHIMGIYSR
jgi:Raf kinase inhibitor-like YbhB/YbcL family protein